MPRDKESEAERQDRLARALRQNLQKRKTQERQRGAPAATRPRQDDPSAGEGGQDA